MPKFANPQTLERLLTLVKGYVDENVRKKMDSFTPGEGLSLENGILTVTLNTDLFKVVTSLPTTPAASDANKIFMVLDSSNPNTGNIYIEYLYTEQGWEEIGRRQVEMDMEPYLKKAELTATVSSTSFAIQKGSEQLGVIVFGSNDFTGSHGAKSLNVSLRDVLSATVSSGLYKIALDKKGRVTGYTAVQLSDLTALGVAKEADLQTTNQNLAKEVKDRQDAIKGVGDTITATKETLEAADQANATRIQQLESTTEAQGVEIQSLKESVNIEPLKERVDILETTTEAQGVEIQSLKYRVDIIGTGSPFFVAAYAKGTNDSTPLFSHGNPEICKKFDFFLLDTSDNAGEYTTPVGKLMKNNLLRFANGGYAPTVGITQAMHDECMTQAIYTKDAEGNYTEAYAAGAFDPDAQWEIDKALIAKGQEPTTFYKKVGDAYVPVSHVLRPWETTETKYTVGIAAAQDLYLLDNVKGTSGRYWKGIFTEPSIWDGIDLSKFKLARTAMGPCPMTTVVDGGVTKCRCFFYLYEAAHDNCKSNPGWFTTNNPFYNKNRHYPRTSDVQQVTNMNWARANNADTTKSYPFAEGGWWATNAHIIALELLAETRYLHQANLFGSGISSNDGTNATNFYTSGGARLRVKGDEAWFYKTFGDKCAPYYYNNYKGEVPMSKLLTQYAPTEAAMESQMAASMATELGIAPTESADALNTFKFYGDTYYYMNVPGFAGLQDGDMNVKVYKVQTADVEGFNSNKQATTFEFELVFCMSLFNGANLCGDIWAYNGGGLEMVGTRETDDRTGHHVDVYLQPDQKQWHHDSTARKNIGETWDFEKTYIKVGEYETLGDSYTLERMSNSPVRIKQASNMSQGENYYMSDSYYWANKGQRGRMKSMFRGKSSGSRDSARYMLADNDVLHSDVSYGGSFQALIDPQA